MENSLTIKQIYDKLDKFVDDERTKFLKGLAKSLCQVSITSLKNFQNNFDFKRPYDEFVIEQNKIIKRCINLETSELGKIVRKQLGLGKLTLSTIIEAC